MRPQKAGRGGEDGGQQPGRGQAVTWSTMHRTGGGLGQWAKGSPQLNAAGQLAEVSSFLGDPD